MKYVYVYIKVTIKTPKYVDKTKGAKMREQKEEEEEKCFSSSILAHRNDEESIFHSKDSTIKVHSCKQITPRTMYPCHSKGPLINFFAGSSKHFLSSP